MSDTSTPVPPQSIMIKGDAVALHYKAGYNFWEQRALALQDQLLSAVAERNALAEELDRLKNPPAVVTQPQPQV